MLGCTDHWRVQKSILSRMPCKMSQAGTSLPPELGTSRLSLTHFMGRHHGLHLHLWSSMYSQNLDTSWHCQESLQDWEYVSDWYILFTSGWLYISIVYMTKKTYPDSLHSPQAVRANVITCGSLVSCEKGWRSAFEVLNFMERNFIRKNLICSTAGIVWDLRCVRFWGQRSLNDRAGLCWHGADVETCRIRLF